MHEESADPTHSLDDTAPQGTPHREHVLFPKGSHRHPSLPATTRMQHGSPENNMACNHAAESSARHASQRARERTPRTNETRAEPLKRADPKPEQHDMCAWAYDMTCSVGVPIHASHSSTLTLGNDWVDPRCKVRLLMA